MYFHSNLTLKVYLLCDIFPCWLHFLLFIFIRGAPPPPYTKRISPQIWTNLKNDPKYLKENRILQISETLTCLKSSVLILQWADSPCCYLCKKLMTDFIGLKKVVKKGDPADTWENRTPTRHAIQNGLP